MEQEKIDLIEQLLKNPKYRQQLIEYEIMINNSDNN